MKREKIRSGMLTMLSPHDELIKGCDVTIRDQGRSG
jgi:hypothetical protein